MKVLALIALLFCSYTAISHFANLLVDGGTGWDGLWFFAGLWASVVLIVGILSEDRRP